MASKNNVSTQPADVVTPSELAEILALSQKDIELLVRNSVLVRKLAVIRGRQRVCFDWRDAVRSYCVHVRRPREESREGYAEEKRLTQAIVRQQKELELAIARGDMVKRSRVVFVVTGYFTTIKNHVLALPSKCSRQLLGKRNIQEIRAVLDPACRACLRETATFGAHSFDETSKNGTHSQGENDRGDNLRQRIKRRRRTRRA